MEAPTPSSSSSISLDSNHNRKIKRQDNSLNVLSNLNNHKKLEKVPLQSEKSGAGGGIEQVHLQKNRFGQIVKSKAYEWILLIASCTYMINLIVCAHFEDKYHVMNLEINVGQVSNLELFLIFDTIKLILLVGFLLDNIFNACAYGLKQRS